VVEWIAKRMVAALRDRESHPKFKDVCAPDVLDHLKFCYQEFKNDILHDQNISKLEAAAGEPGFKVKWKTGGFAIGDDIFDAVASAAPCDPIPSLLIDVIEKRQVARHYYLSPNAAQGILRRVSSQGRELFEPLQEALVRLAGKQIVNKMNARRESSSQPFYEAMPKSEKGYAIASGTDL
jgi:DNA (cytosine-5)-methyltransferase 1